MALDKRSFAKFLLIGAIAPFAACSSDDSTPQATGGSAGTDGGVRTDARAAGGAGGSAGTGGGGSAGASAGSAGASAGAAGTASEGGAGSAVVDSGDVSDGDGAVACTTPLYSNVSTFGSIFDGWAVANNSDQLLLTHMDADGGTIQGTQAALDTMVGNPTVGSVKLTIPFSGPSQHLLFARNYATGVNMTGATVTAQIRLDSGLNATPLFSGEAFLVVKTTQSYTYAEGAHVNLDSAAGWLTLRLNVDAPSPTPTPGHTPCDVREIDIVIQTPDGFVDLPDASTYTTAVLHIDTIAIGAPSDGGTDPAPVVDASLPLPEAAVDAAVGADAGTSDATGQ